MPEALDEPTLDLALKSLAAFIEKAGTGGGLFRHLLAQGCSDIAHQIDDPSLPPLVEAASHAATAWTSLAAAAVGARTDTDPGVRWLTVTSAAQRLPKLEAILIDKLARAATALTDPQHMREPANRF